MDNIMKGFKTYVNLYNPTSKKEGFAGEYNLLTNIVWLIVVSVALYLAYRRNNGFDILSFLAAFFCPVLYIIYIGAVTGFNFKNFTNINPYPAPIPSAFPGPYPGPGPIPVPGTGPYPSMN